MSQAPTTAAPTTAPKRRSFAWRWTRRLLIFVVGFVIVLVVLVQALLWSDLPRRIAVSQAQQVLGVRVAIDEVSITWGGRTTVSNLRVAAPSGDLDHPAVRVPTVVVDHTPIWGLPFAVDLHAVELREAALDIRQRPDGVWNVQEIADRIDAVTGPKPGTQGQNTAGNAGVPKLPAVALKAATVTVTDKAGKTTTIKPVDLTGDNADPLLYKLKLAIADAVRADGQLVPGGKWSHDLAFNVTAPDRLAGNLVDGLPKDVQLVGHWRGQTAPAGGVAGELTLDKLVYGDTLLVQNASLGLSTAGELAVRTNSVNASAGGQNVNIAGGAVALEGNTVKIRDLVVNALGAAGRVNGSVDLATLTGSAQLTFDGMPGPQGVSLVGSAGATVNRTPAGGLDVKLVAKAAGTIATTPVAAEEEPTDPRVALDLTVTGGGPDWNQMDWVVNAKDLRVAGQSFPNVVARLNNRQPRPDRHVILLEELNVSGRTAVTGNGGLYLDDWRPVNWWLWFNAVDLPIDVPQRGTVPVYLNLNSWGDVQSATFNDLYVRGTDLEISGEGKYLFNLAETVTTQPTTVASRLPNPSRDAPSPVPQSTPPSTNPVVALAERQRDPLRVNLYLKQLTALEGADLRQEIVEGTIAGAVVVRGKVVPLDLGFEGDLQAENLEFLDRPLERTRISVAGQATARGLSFKSRELLLLGGKWELTGDVPKSRHRPARFAASVVGLPLADVSRFLQVDKLDGTASGRVEIVLPGLDRARANVDGHLAVDTFGYNGGAVRADRVDIPITVRGNDVKIAPSATLAEGRADVELTTALNQRQQISAKVNVRNWPLSLPDSSAQVFLTAVSPQPISVNLAQVLRRDDKGADVRGLSVDGTLNLDLRSTWFDEPLGTAKGELLAQRRAFVLREFEAKALDGSLSAEARYELDRPLSAIVSAKWSGFDGERIAQTFPAVAGLKGKFEGTLDLKPSVDPRPLGKLRLDLTLKSTDAAYRTAGIGDVFVTGYVDGRDDAAMPFSRFVTSDARVDVAGGSITPFVRANLRENGPLWTLVQLDLNGLDMAQIAPAAVPQNPPDVVGLVGGQVTVLGDPVEPTRLVASGRLRLTKTDLVRAPVISQMYDLMNVGRGGREPSGRAMVEFRLEKGNLDVSRAYLFNRGIELNAQLTATDLLNWPNTGLDGYAYGTARPLKDVKIPFLADTDAVLSALQGTVTSFVIKGSPADGNYGKLVRPAAIADLGEGLRNLMLGQAREGREGR
jgi:hypothetical protein